MGSHGGATPHGQVETLRSLGITEESVCAPIISSMEVDKIGEIKGTPVYIDRNALRADGIIVVGRVKPHTDFKGEIESGLMKMMAIGLGKQKGAEMIHHNLYEGYHTLLPAAARLIMEKAPILMGLALLENARHETAKVVALEPEEFEAAELKLLQEAKSLLARLPFQELDVLVVEEIGKNISGVGMDTNVTGRFWMPGESDPDAREDRQDRGPRPLPGDPRQRYRHRPRRPYHAPRLRQDRLPLHLRKLPHPGHVRHGEDAHLAPQRQGRHRHRPPRLRPNRPQQGRR